MNTAFAKAITAGNHLSRLTPPRTQSSDPATLSVLELMHWGQQLVDAEHHTAAADIFRYVLLIAPATLSAWHALGLCHQEDGDFEAAAKLFELGSEIGQRAAFLQLAARSWFQAGDQERGSTALHAAWDSTQ